MSDIHDLVLARFLTLYGEPKTDNLEAFIGEYEAALAGMSREVLQGGANRVIRAQEYRSWPTPGECVKACALEAEKLTPRSAFASANFDSLDHKWPAPTEESKERVRQLVADLKRGMVVSGPAAGGGLTDKSKRMTGEAASGE
jgi:hypothetical protein